jgi:hypothetical protein
VSTDTDALVVFLRARLNEDEQVALAATPGPWQANRLSSTGYFVGDGHGCAVARLWVEMDELIEGPQPVGGNPLDTSKHIARHDPARVLRRVEAGRKLIKLCEKRWTHDLRGTDAGLEMALELAAYEYADHPDYQESWRP